MGKVTTHMTMSLDGYIADPSDQVGELFDWYQAGDVAVGHASDDLGEFNVDKASAEVLRDMLTKAGALITGRHLFDIANGWNDAHPAGAKVVVVTHEPPADAAETWPKTTFVGGVEEAVAKAKELAGDKDVSIASANVIQQALNLGLVDEVAVSLVPVLFGAGKSYFGRLDDGHLMLEDPDVVKGHRAVHLLFKVHRPT
ncbi:MAG TPA: dihydrofolate reductase family protein [Candidatus Limnocylindrales bacterium]|nr:dihydrofolate reductase family protein [Candidatus Limnocylindrales bacterium]